MNVPLKVKVLSYACACGAVLLAFSELEQSHVVAEHKNKYPHTHSEYTTTSVKSNPRTIAIGTGATGFYSLSSGG